MNRCFICPICGKPAQTSRSDARTCGPPCSAKYVRITPAQCACGSMGVKRTGGEWVCARCLAIEAANDKAWHERVIRAQRLKYERTLEELGWCRFLARWIPEARQREQILRNAWK